MQSCVGFDVTLLPLRNVGVVIDHVMNATSPTQNGSCAKRSPFPSSRSSLAVNFILPCPRIQPEWNLKWMMIPANAEYYTFSDQYRKIWDTFYSSSFTRTPILTNMSIVIIPLHWEYYYMFQQGSPKIPSVSSEASKYNLRNVLDQLSECM